MAYQNSEITRTGLLVRRQRAVISIPILILVYDIFVLARRSIGIDYAGYAICLSMGGFLLLLGSWYRYFRLNETIASTLLAAGSFVIFTISASILNYLLLPDGHAGYDKYLMKFDQFLGYDWIGYVSWFSQHRFLVSILAFVYASSQLQLILITLLLGLRGETEKLIRFVLTAMASALICIAIWSIFPTFGPAASSDLPRDIFAGTFLIVGPEYGSQLRHIAVHGVDAISPLNTLGLIAFPSFHSVMAAMAIMFTWSIKSLRYVFLILNSAMLPAVLLHGGHHLTDIPGGVLAFAVAYLAMSPNLSRHFGRQI